MHQRPQALSAAAAWQHAGLQIEEALLASSPGDCIVAAVDTCQLVHRAERVQRCSHELRGVALVYGARASPFGHICMQSWLVRALVGRSKWLRCSRSVGGQRSASMNSDSSCKPMLAAARSDVVSLLVNKQGL